MQFSDEYDDPLPPKMPALLRILAMLHLIAGGFMLVTMVQALARGVDLSAPAEIIGTSTSTMFAGMVFLALLGLATGVGMFSGRPWGWWVAAFYYVYAIMRAGNGMLFTIGFWDQLAAEGDRGPDYHLRKFGVRMALHALILVYLFSRPVIDYFGLERLSRWRAAAKLIGIPVVLYVLTNAANLLMFR